MAGALRKTMLYLGLADDRAEHEDYLDDYDDGEVAVPTEYEAQVTPLHRPTRSAVPTQASASVQSPALPASCAASRRSTRARTTTRARSARRSARARP